MRHPVSSRPCLLRARATDPMHLFLVGRHIQRSSRLLMLRRCGTASRAGAAVRQISFWGEEANERAVLEHIRKSLGEEDWTGADREVVEELGAAFLLEKYGTLAAAAEAHAIPSRAAPSAADNLVATMSAKSHGSEGMEGTSGKRGGREPSQWASKESRRRFFDGVAASLALESTQDWRSVPRQSITRLGGKGLLARYNSLAEALRDCYGEEVLVEEKRDWSCLQEQRKFLESVAEEMDIKCAADWKDVGYRTIVAAGGGPLLKRHNGSVHDALTACFPEIDFGSAREARRHVTKGYWAKPENQRALLDGIARRMGVEKTEDWRRVRRKHIKEAGGARLLTLYNGSILGLLRAVYPEEEWVEYECRPNVSAGYWSNSPVQRQFLEGYAKRHSIEREEDWAKVTHEAVAAAGGGGLLREHGGSLFNALAAAFPERQWNMLRCRPVLGESFWTEDAVIECVEALRDHLGVESAEEWARISERDILRAGSELPLPAHKMLQQRRLSEALAIAYPEQDWSHVDQPSSGFTKKSSQRVLRQAVQRLFPRDSVVEDHLHEGITRSSSRQVELDVYLPAQNLAFEYQGEHHFHELPAFGSLEACKHRDLEKRELCEAHGVRLVEVPYWWDYSFQSLAATIHVQYPALMRETATRM